MIADYKTSQNGTCHVQNLPNNELLSYLRRFVNFSTLDKWIWNLFCSSYFEHPDGFVVISLFNSAFQKSLP